MTTKLEQLTVNGTTVTLAFDVPPHTVVSDSEIDWFDANMACLKIDALTPGTIMLMAVDTLRAHGYLVVPPAKGVPA